MEINEIIQTGKRLYERNLTVSTSGNISVKTEKGIYITATGTQLGNLKREDIVLTDYEGKEISAGKASSEAKMHIEIYKKRPDIKAIIHTHPVYLSSFAACGKGIDELLLSESVLYFEDIPVAPYAMPSSDKLADVTSDYMRNRDVVIMSNHGAVAGGKTLECAFEKMETAEYYAHVVLNSKIMKCTKSLTKDDVSDLLKLKNKL